LAGPSGGGQWGQPAGRNWGPHGVDWSAAGSGSADPGTRSADPGGWPGGPPADNPVTRQTQAGLPQRVPRGNAGFDGQPSGYEAPQPDQAPVLGAPPPGKGSGSGAQQQTPRRRSPEAARNRLTGFQLGNRDATQAGSTPGWAPYAGEETSR